MSDSDSDAAAVPADVLEAINLTRPRCWWYYHKGCKKGARCRFLHGVAESIEAHLPHVSIHKDRDGDVKLNVRPPLHAAWDQFFWQKRIHRKISSGKHSDAEGNWMMYQLSYMEERDTNACAASATQQRVEDSRNESIGGAVEDVRCSDDEEEDEMASDDVVAPMSLTRGRIATSRGCLFCCLFRVFVPETPPRLSRGLPPPNRPIICCLSVYKDAVRTVSYV